MQRALLSRSLIGLALGALVSTSEASFDYKYLPGAACQPQIGAQGGDFERFPQSILNVGETGRTVICPIVRDSALQSDLDIGVTVTKGVRCTFFSMSRSGDVGSSFAPTSTEAVDVDREIQFFSILPAAATEFDGYYALQCTLPPGTEVFRLVTGEAADTTAH
jgi:hypothetical protein